MQLNLSKEESALLVSILSAYRSDLRVEIGRTEGAEYKRRLKQEEEMVERLLCQLAAEVPA